MKQITFAMTDDGKSVLVNIPLDGQRRVSSTGKTLLVQSESIKVPYNGEDVRVQINATVPNPAKAA